MKTSQLLSRASRMVLGGRTAIHPSLALRTAQSTARLSQPLSISTTRSFTSTPYTYKGLQPDTSDPKAPQTASHEPTPTEPTKISDSEYSEIADQYMNTLQSALEEKAEHDTEIEAEYSVRSYPVSRSLLSLFYLPSTLVSSPPSPYSPHPTHPIPLPFPPSINKRTNLLLPTRPA